MKIGGFQKLSLVDYPGKLASIVFTVGCNFRCIFCYVPKLVLPKMAKDVMKIREEYVFSYLERNRKFLDAVVVTGGEPTVNEDLPVFLKRVKGMGFLVGLETNGANFPMLKELVEKNWVDYVAMDIKTVLEFERYREIVGVLDREKFESVKKSIKFLIESGVEHEFRTTLVKEFHTKDDIIEICKNIQGAKVYFLQNLKRFGELVGGGKLTPFGEKEIEEIVAEGRKFVNVKYRG